MDQELFKFFLVVPPGFEELALKELKVKYAQLFSLDNFKSEAVHGGVDFEAPLVNGCHLNHYLKIPTKILLRIEEFKSRDFPKLFNKLKKIDVKKYIPDLNFNIEASSKKSRLINEKRIISTAHDALRPIEKPSKVALTMFIRFYDDICTVSLDTSGELLFKRGYKQHVNEAPIRENLAAALVYFLTQNFSSDATYALVDPMCGSGTFLTEALTFFEPVDTRKFAFENFSFLTQKKFTPVSLKGPRPYRVIGLDIATVDIVRTNFLSLQKKMKIEKVSFECEKVDLFQVIAPIKDKNLILICNPPYGKLIKLPEPPEAYYKNVIQRLGHYQALTFGCILPRAYANGTRAKQKIDFSNGGIPVSFLRF